MKYLLSCSSSIGLLINNIKIDVLFFHFFIVAPTALSCESQN